VSGKRDEATLLLHGLYRTVTSKVGIGNVCAVTPYVSQLLVRVLLRPAFPIRFVTPVSARLQDVEVGKVWIADADALDDLGKRRKWVWHPHPCQITN
jgi:hypothetical protein